MSTQELGLYLLLLALGVAGCRLSANPLRPLALGLFRPLHLLVVFWLGYLTVSYLGTHWLVQEGIFAPIDFRLALVVHLAALAAVLAGFNLFFWFLSPPPSRRTPDGELRFDLAFLELLSSLAVLACLAAITLWFWKTGVVPMLYDGDRDAIRVELASAPGLGTLTRLMYLSPLALMLKFTCFSLPGRRHLWVPRWADAGLATVLLVALILYGSKMLYVAAFGMWLMNYNFFCRRVPLFRLRWLAVGVLGVVLLTLATNIRGTGASIVIDPVSDLLVVFPEYRDMAQTLNIAVEQNLYVDSLWVGLTSAIPREAYSVLGLEKPTARMDDLAFFQKQLLGLEFSGGSARTGVFSELFLNARWLGVLIGGLILGFLFGWMENLLRVQHLYEFRVMLANVFTVQLAWFLLAELSTHGPIFFLSLYFMLLVSWLVRRPPDAERRVLAVPATERV